MRKMWYGSETICSVTGFVVCRIIWSRSADMWSSAWCLTKWEKWFTIMFCVEDNLTKLAVFPILGLSVARDYVKNRGLKWVRLQRKDFNYISKENWQVSKKNICIGRQRWRTTRYCSWHSRGLYLQSQIYMWWDIKERKELGSCLGSRWSEWGNQKRIPEGSQTCRTKYQ